MHIKEYNAQNTGKQVLVLQEREIKDLMHFSTVAKNDDLNGLIASGKYVGFTDTYRLAAVKDTREELPGADTNLYPASVLGELKKARSMAILKDGKLAIQVGEEVTEYEPAQDVKVPNIQAIINNYEYDSLQKAKAINKITDDVVWKMLKLIDSTEVIRYFCFNEGKMLVEAYPNENSTLSVEVLELDNKKAKLKTTLNIKFTDLWLKYAKDEKFEIALAKNNRNAIQFRKDGMFYVIMPINLRT